MYSYENFLWCVAGCQQQVGRWQQGKRKPFTNKVQVDFNLIPPQQNDVIVDYVKIMGTGCGGGVASTNPSQSSSGFRDRAAAPEWLPNAADARARGGSAFDAKDMPRIGAASKMAASLLVVFSAMIII